MTFRFFLAALAALTLGGSALGAETPHRSRQCLNAADAREVLARNTFTDPAAALRSAAAVAHADPLRSRLCRWNEDYVYEITLLRRDGKVMKVFIKAEDGSLVNARANP
jgi:uncharacterized membrane protein YkoI